MLDYYELVLAQKAWTQNGTTVSRNGQTLNVGDSVTLKVGTADAVSYSDSIASGADGDYTGNWVVLGAEYGKLLLVSATTVPTRINLGLDDYLNSGAKLHEICANYINNDYADEARSIKVEDINRVTGFKPESYTDYGKTYVFTSNFMYIDGRIATTENPITVKNDYYGYLGSEYMAVDDQEYLTIFGSDYILPSTVVAVESGYAEYYFQHVYERTGVSSTGAGDSSTGWFWDRPVSARAVVSIKPDIQVQKAS